jgi:hypothetical protein
MSITSPPWPGDVPVRVYWNLVRRSWTVLLRRGWTLPDRRTGRRTRRVWGRGTYVVLRRARFVVWESGRRRYLRGDRRRRIHYWVDGYLSAWPGRARWEYVGYQPSRAAFVSWSGNVVTEAPLVVFDDRGWVFASWGRKARAIAKAR